MLYPECPILFPSILFLVFAKEQIFCSSQAVGGTGGVILGTTLKSSSCSTLKAGEIHQHE